MIRRTRTVALVLGLAAILGSLTGCGNVPQGAGARNDPVTESDESPERRRARIRLELAVGYFEEGRTPIALDEIKQVLASDPSFAPAYNLRGLIYMRLADLRQAEDSFRRALALDSRDGDTLHNYGWLMCQQARHAEALQAFEQALANPTYTGRAKTFMAQGLCLARAGRNGDAERSLARSYELDAANPVTGYNLSRLLLLRGELERAQFYIRRLNNSEFANAESLWLGIRVEQRIGDRVAMQQLGDQLRKRYPQSRELVAYDRGAFDE
ncbi:type IV pilus biogenesis/stability protein PilW [Ramlibacter sp. MAHUQ-53]|uniref:type IV pilus biogenesis/stability protein PilW n=1 Tax=unclassified Ramlibacter TaxID=2617605 RepID=UPI003632D079